MYRLQTCDNYEAFPYVLTYTGSEKGPRISETHGIAKSFKSRDETVFYIYILVCSVQNKHECMIGNHNHTRVRNNDNPYSEQGNFY